MATTVKEVEDQAKAKMDQALSALIEDVYLRGLDRKILIVAMGEFGRTPRLVERSGLLGRDH